MLSGFPDVLQKLLGQEFRAQRGALTALFLIWLAGLWILVIFSHPGWLLGLGLFYVAMVAPMRAGVDVMEGTEEFSFSLPPGRGPLYIARALPGVVFIVMCGLVGGVSIAFDLPQMAWSLVFSGGLTEPFAPVEGNFFWYALAVVFPLAAHAITFFVAANATSRGMVTSSWFFGVVGALVLAALVALAEGSLWREPNGLLAAPVLLSTAIMVHLAGYRAYLGKEATRSGGQVPSSSGRWWIVVVVAIVGLLLLMMMSFVVMKDTQMENKVEATERMRTLESSRAAAEDSIKATEAPEPPEN